MSSLFSRRLFLLLGVPFLGACAVVGPNYRPPEAVKVMPPAFKEVEGWKVADPREGLAGERWWELYEEPRLNALLEQAAEGNQNLIAAAGRLRQARGLAQTARAGVVPVVGGGGAASQGRRSENLASNGGDGDRVTDLQLPLQLAWEVDLWGKIQRGVEVGAANLAAAGADLGAVRLGVEAELVGDYFQLQTIDLQKQLLENTLVAQRRIQEVVGNRYAAGVVGRAEELQAASQVQGVELQVAELELQRVQLEHAVAVLLGTTPAALALPPQLPAAPIVVLPPGLPSALLEARPDIAAAERRMAAANAQIGVAAAAYYPTLRLGATAGVESAALGRLLSWPSRFWSLGPTLATTFFDGGLREGQSEQALAAYDGTVAAYRQTVLTAFREVEDALAALRLLAEEARAQEAGVVTARQAVTVVANQYRAGTVSYLNLLLAQTSLLAHERTAATIQGRRLAASVLLIKALGGGWRRPE